MSCRSLRWYSALNGYSTFRPHIQLGMNRNNLFELKSVGFLKGLVALNGILSCSGVALLWTFGEAGNCIGILHHESERPVC